MVIQADPIAAAMKGAGFAQQPSPMPLFYKRPVALSPARHFGLSFVGIDNYGFARDTNSIPLSVNEFSLAVRHYPIVFTGVTPAIPVAVVGIHKDTNLFVDGAGRWQEGSYIPAYLRRYPFIFIEDGAKKKKQFVLAIDEAADAIAEKGAEDGRDTRLFWEGKPTAFVQTALAFCSEYQANVNLTRNFCRALEAESLLVDKEADFKLQDGRRFRLTGIRVVDEAKLDQLSSKTFLRFRRSGWLHPIYLHLASMANLAVLVDMAAKHGT